MLFAELRTLNELIMKDAVERFWIKMKLKFEDIWDYIKVFAEKYRTSYYYNLFH